MDLKEFVSETLKEIIAGVKDAQEYAKENGACVNPTEFGTLAKPEHVIDMGDGKLSIVQSISFDICVSDKRTKSGKGGIEIVSGGYEGTKATENRVKFSVAVALPRMNVTSPRTSVSSSGKASDKTTRKRRQEPKETK